MGNERWHMQFISVSDAARQLGVNPRAISDLFYHRQLRDDLCPIVAGRRIIPTDYIDMIRAALRRAGKLPRIHRARQELAHV